MIDESYQNCIASEAHSLCCSMWNFHDEGDRDAFVSTSETLSNAGKTLEAIDLLNKIHEKGIFTDTMKYNIVFAALGKLKQLSYIQTLYKQMRDSGPSPDIFTYNILLSSFGKVGLVEKVLEVFKEIQKRGLNPDIVTYSTLIKCFGKTNKVEMAFRLFDEMIDEGCHPNIVTCNVLLDLLERSIKYYIHKVGGSDLQTFELIKVVILDGIVDSLYY